MCQWIAGLCAAAALAVGMLCSPSFCRAKPPDLPRDITQRCPESFDGPHAEGFSAPSEPPPRQPPVTPTEREEHPSPLSPWGRGVGGEGYSRDAHPAGAAEEQDAPPERRWFREPTENRRADLPATPQRRDMDRSSNDDARRLEMLRQTEPLDTQPRRPTVQERTQRADELQLVHYDESLPLVSVEVKRMPSADEAQSPSAVDLRRQWRAFINGGFTLEPSHYVEFPWGSWYLRNLQGFMIFDWSQPGVGSLEADDKYESRGFSNIEGSVTHRPPAPALYVFDRELRFNSIGVMYGVIRKDSALGFLSHPQFVPYLEFKFDSIGRMYAVIPEAAFAAPTEPDPDCSKKVISCCPGFASPIVLRPFIGVSATPYLDELCERFGVRGFVDCDGSIFFDRDESIPRLPVGVVYD